MLSAYQKTFVKIKGSIHLTFNTYIHLHIYDIYIYMLGAAPTFAVTRWR